MSAHIGIGQPAAGLVEVGQYQRRMPVSLERMYENALDWEHLPWLHSRSFKSLQCLDAGDWGWRADAVLQPIPSGAMGSTTEWKAALAQASRQQPLRTLRFLAGTAGQLLLSRSNPSVCIELRLDKDRRTWVTRTLQGNGQGSEIWTTVTELGPKDIEVQVRFLMPQVPNALAPLIGRYYEALYADLYDEDQGMMEERQQQLRGREKAPTGNDPLALGALSELQAELPKTVAFAGRDWRIVWHQGQLLAHGTLCPHWLGPLEEAEIRNGEIICPWHGYGFDLATGASTGSHRCRLPKPPVLEVKDGQVWMRSPAGVP